MMMDNDDDYDNGDDIKKASTYLISFYCGYHPPPTPPPQPVISLRLPVHTITGQKSSLRIEEGTKRAGERENQHNVTAHVIPIPSKTGRFIGLAKEESRPRRQPHPHQGCDNSGSSCRHQWHRSETTILE
jgi:hypothetical protein